MNWLFELDKQGLYLVNKGFRGVTVDSAMSFFSGIADGAILFAVALALMVSRRAKDKAAGIILTASLAASYQVCALVKEVIARPRPFVALPDVNILVHVGGFSMPSNHAATAFAAAYILSGYYRKPFVFYSVAVIISIARVYLGVHYPSDVLAGAFIGMVIGYTLVHVAERAGIVHHLEHKSRPRF